MTKANRLGMYADVRQVLDQALQSGGGVFTCATYGAAVHWRQRAYRFRKLYAETLGAKAMSEYDVLVMPRIEEGTSNVVIDIRKSAGIFAPAHEPDLMVGTTNDDLMEAATALARKLQGDVQ